MENKDIPFKKPTLIGKVGKLPRKLNKSNANDESIDIEKPFNNIQQQLPSNITTTGDLIERGTIIHGKPLSTSLNIVNPYKEPKWSGVPGTEVAAFSFEVIKSGVILETLELNSKAYWVFGRLDDCDIVMAHPTISRYHAVLQFQPIDIDNRSKGWYIFDLNSTHGTYLNKNKVPAKSYVHVKPGFILKLGGSSRNYILQGNSGDYEDNDMTITEMIQRKEDLKNEIIRREIEFKEKKEKEENQGINWGMGEDADEESDLSENPFAMTNNEELFLDDPKKTLRGFFEREGLELIYDVEDKGPAHFICRIELPVDDANGRPIIAQCSHHGKKKEVVVQCALEACRILDRVGVLRQSNHEPRKRKPKSSDSEDDDFWDRTGEIERKRLKKLQQQKTEPKTHIELMNDEKELLLKISNLESKLSSSSKSTTIIKHSNESDELDNFMSELQEQKLDSITKKKIMLELKQLREDHKNIQKLIKIAEPNKLPELQIVEVLPTEESVKSTMKDKKWLYPLFGKRIKSKNKNIIDKNDPEIKIDMKCVKPVLQQIIQLDKSQDSTLISSAEATNSDQVTNLKLMEPEPEMNIEENQEIASTIKNVVSSSCEDAFMNNISSNTEILISGKYPKARRNRFRDRTKDDRSVDHSEKIEELGEKYNTWVPPEGQTGDGRTKLNEKFGY